MLSQTRRFEVQSTFEDNKILYVVTTRGELFPDNTQSKAITFDFKRLDKKKLTKLKLDSYLRKTKTFLFPKEIILKHLIFNKVKKILNLYGFLGFFQ